MTVTTGGMTTATWCASAARDRRGNTATAPRAGWRACVPSHRTSDIRIPYATDPAGNRLPDPELHPDSTLTAWPDNRIAEDAHYVYHYDEYGRLTEKTDLIPAGVIRTDDERTHHRQPAPSGVPHADTAWRATGREPLPLRPAGTANGETGMAAGA